MPRPTRSPAAARQAAQVVAEAAKVQPNALVSSAANIAEDVGAVPVRSGGAKDWQSEGWYFYDTVGEFRFACTWKSQCLSRVKLYISEDQDDGTELRIDAGPEVDALNILFGGDAGQSQGLAQMGLHLSVAGETWLVGEVVNKNGAEADVWTIYSNDELTQKGTGSNGVRTYQIDRGDGAKRIIKSDEAIVIRIWRSHPRKWVEADSPARASIPVLRQLEQMAKRTAAHIDSRLAGAGLLLLPTEMSFGSPTGAPVTGADVDEFMAALTDAMLAPLGDRGSASAMVPLVVRAPGALLDKIKHVTFASPLDDKGIEQQEANIRRLALTADMPAEVMLGLGDSNHWSAWQIDEAGIKAHVEPDCELVTAGLTEKWLQPAVKAMGEAVNPRRRINFDTSDLRLRPDRTAQTQWLYEHLELDGETTRRELGIEGTAPTDEELRRLLLLRVATGVTTPDVVLAALKELGAGIDVVPVESRTGLPPAEVVPKGDKVVPKPASPGDRNLPTDTGPPAAEAPATAAAALLAGAELVVKRAVERANNKANNRSKVRRPIPADKLDACLDGAWDSVPRTAELLAVDPGWLRDALDTYTRALLREGVEHQPQVLARLLSDPRVMADA